MLDANNQEIDLKQTFDDDDIIPQPVSDEDMSFAVDEGSLDDGYTLDSDGEDDSYLEDDSADSDEDSLDFIDAVDDDDDII